jgi:hypothetical protein
MRAGLCHSSTTNAQGGGHTPCQIWVAMKYWVKPAMNHVRRPRPIVPTRGRPTASPAATPKEDRRCDVEPEPDLRVGLGISREPSKLMIGAEGSQGANPVRPTGPRRREPEHSESPTTWLLPASDLAATSCIASIGAKRIVSRSRAAQSGAQEGAAPT